MATTSRLALICCCIFEKDVHNMPTSQETSTFGTLFGLCLGCCYHCCVIIAVAIVIGIVAIPLLWGALIAV